jgi:PAS domain S-box-containing protein
MNINLEKKTNIAFLFIAIVLVTILVVFYVNTNNIKSTNIWVEHTQDVLRVSDNILLDVLNIETGSRGYLISKNDIFLEPFNKSVITINENINNLKKLTKDNNSQQKRIIQLKAYIIKKVLFSNQLIEVRRNKDLVSAEKLMSKGQGKILTDDIRLIIAEINTEEFRLLKLRKEESKKNNIISELIFIFFLTFIIVIIFLISVLIRNQKARNIITKELSKSTELFANLFNYNPASISIKNLDDGKIINVNNSFLKLFGFNNVNEVIGKTSHELNVFMNVNHTEDVTKLLQKNKIIKDYETEIITKQGDIKWTSASILLLEVDNSACIFSVSTDISYRKKAEDQLLAVNKELEAFTYSVSHDLRAPLRAINGYAKILQEDYSEKLDKEGISSLTAITKNSKRMGELIDDLLAFSRLGRKEITTTEINMLSLVNSVKEEELIGINNHVDFVMKEILPANGQQALIKQVWVNLISNAIKYSQHQTHISIEIGSYKKDNMIIYYVKDNGVGFDMQYYDKLFGVFQRLHSQDEFEGTGIGLAIVQKIINRHNGKVWATSKINEGSSFYFSLPITNN